MLDDMAIAHLYYAFAHGRGLRVVRDHHDCLVEPVIQLLEHVKDQCGVLRIEIPCRFIG